jgi:hypothetical protein
MVSREFGTESIARAEALTSPIRDPEFSNEPPVLRRAGYETVDAELVALDARNGE